MTDSLTLKVYPMLALAAKRLGLIRGLEVWHLARALDTEGAGVVSYETLKERGVSLMGVSAFKRAHTCAHRVGLYTLGEKWGGSKVIALSGLERVARMLKVNTLGASPVALSANVLRSLPDFKAALWAAQHEGRSKRAAPITRATLEAITGLPVRTQRDYEQRAGVTVTRNYARSNIEAETPQGTQLNKNLTTRYASATAQGMAETHPGVFTIYDKESGKYLVAWALPSSYKTSLQKTKRGMMTKVNRHLREVNLFNDAGRAMATREARVFFVNDDDKKNGGAFSKALKASERRSKHINGAIDTPARRHEPTERYYTTSRLTRFTRARVWGVINSDSSVVIA